MSFATEENLKVFQDTQSRIQASKLLQGSIQKSKAGTVIYNPKFKSRLSGNKFPKTDIRVEESLTLLVAANLKLNANKRYGKVGVLNFASPIHPGGGVVSGASAQEEYLCRASTLYNCLNSEEAFDFYRYHRVITSRLATDRVVYTPDVTVIKEDIGYKPNTLNVTKQEYTNNWFNIDVLTCAAPCLVYPMANDQLENLLTSRIRNIFEVAIEHGEEALVLGAFGCGAFHNPPLVVAEAFHTVLAQRRYSHAFREVVFAIRRTGQICPNLISFQNIFGA